MLIKINRIKAQVATINFETTYLVIAVVLVRTANPFPTLPFYPVMIL